MMFNMFGNSDLREEEMLVIEMISDAFSELKTHESLPHRFQLRGLKIKRVPRGNNDSDLIDYSIKEGRVLYGDLLFRFSGRVFGRPESKMHLYTIITLTGKKGFSGHIYPRSGGGVGSWGAGNRIHFQSLDQRFDSPEGFLGALIRFHLTE